MNGAEYTELRSDIRRLTDKVDKVLSSHGERIARLEQGDVSQAGICATHADEIRTLKESDRKQDRAILKVSLVSSGFVGLILLVARPLVERLLG